MLDEIKRLVSPGGVTVSVEESERQVGAAERREPQGRSVVVLGGKSLEGSDVADSKFGTLAADDERDNEMEESGISSRVLERFAMEQTNLSNR